MNPKLIQIVMRWDQYFGEMIDAIRVDGELIPAAYACFRYSADSVPYLELGVPMHKVEVIHAGQAKVENKDQASQPG